jgi:hypothetical protein
MSNQPHSFSYQPATSPWTEAFAMHFERAEADSTMQPMGAEEAQPTLEALVDVYNRETETQPTSAFVYANA